MVRNIAWGILAAGVIAAPLVAQQAVRPPWHNGWLQLLVHVVQILQEGADGAGAADA